jgi:hypothetical protein
LHPHPPATRNDLPPIEPDDALQGKSLHMAQPDLHIKQRRILALIALVATTTGCMQNPSTPEQAQYAATLRVCPAGYYAESGPYGMAGYRCVKRVAQE